MRNTLLILVIGIAVATPTVWAGHGGDPVTIHRTYEQGTTFVGTHQDDPTGLTQDGTLDIGMTVVIPDELPPGIDSVETFIVDDTFGPGVVAGSFCVYVDDDTMCGEEDDGEPNEIFCGSSPTLSLPSGWWRIDVWVHGPFHQAQFCDPTQGFATSGGVLNANGGIFLTFG